MRPPVNQYYLFINDTVSIKRNKYPFVYHTGEAQMALEIPPKDHFSNNYGLIAARYAWPKRIIKSGLPDDE
jgi:hypothetical protein